MTRARDLASTALNNIIDSTELGYLDGVTAPIQTQLAAKADTTAIPALVAANAPASGLTLITAQGFNASSVVVNNCFSATFDMYRIVISCGHSTETPLLMRLRAGGVDNAANYFSKLMYSRYDGTGVFGDAVRNNSDNFWVGTGGTQRGTVIDVMYPAVATATSIAIVNGDNNAGSSGGGRHSVATAYDGFTLYVTSGTIGGVLRVYGYRN